MRNRNQSSRNNQTNIAVAPIPASAKQLANIQALLKRKRQLHIRELSPFTVALMTMLPALATYLLMGDVKGLNEYWQSSGRNTGDKLLTWYNNLNDEVRDSTQIAMLQLDIKLLVLKSSTILAMLEENIKDAMPYIAQNIDFSTTRGRDLYTEFLAYLDKYDAVLKTFPFFDDNAQATLDTNFPPAPMLQTGDKAYQFYVLANKVLNRRELLGLLLDGKNAQTVKLGLSMMPTMMTEILAMHKTLTSGFILTAVAAKSLLVDPLFGYIYGKFSRYSQFDRLNPVTLTTQEADAYIEDLKSSNAYLAVRARQSIWLMRVFTVVSLVLAAEATKGKGEIEPAILVFILTNVATLINDLLKSGYEYYQQVTLNKRLSAILMQYNKAISCLNKNWEMDYTGEFLIFNGCKYKQLSPYVVNQTLKNILLKQGCEIISYGHNTLTIAAKKISQQQAKLINEFLTNYLDNLLTIKKMTKQITQLLPSTDFVKFVVLDENELPKAKFLLSVASSSYALQTFINIFDRCKVYYSDDKLIIEGCAAASQQVLQQVLDENKFSNNLQSVNSVPVTCSQPAEIKTHIIRAAKPSQVVTTSLQPESTVSERIVKVWPSATYDSEIKNSEVKQLSHELLGRNHFVLFKLPADCFPNPTIYNAIKNKIEEASLAKSNVGAQGLQFRVEVAQDETQPRRPWFRSEMRGKFLGSNLGDIRVYASKETNAEGDHLYVFKGLNLNAH
jgi:hypothetical protein